MNRKQVQWLAVIAFLIIAISLLHYRTPTMKWHFHLVYMQAYFIPILLAAFQFGVKGGLGAAVVISVIYFPHIILQWGGFVDTNLMRFLQIILFNVVGFLTGLKAQGEHEEKVRYQETARELENTLQKQRRQSEKLLEMEQELRAADRLAIVGELSSTLAHEVRNPLGSIRGAVEILREAVPENVKQLEFFDILLQDTERLNHVVENYLSFARRKSETSESYDLREGLQKMRMMIGARARKQNIRIHLELPEEPLIVRTDPNLFWQVAMNIMLNAIQAMHNGGNVTVRTAMTNAPPAAENGNGRYVRVSVRDEGTGMEEEQLRNIFKPFYTTKSNGTGLGLAIVKRIADEHGWKIEVDSEPGQGTEFVLYIPQNPETEKTGSY